MRFADLPVGTHVRAGSRRPPRRTPTWARSDPAVMPAPRSAPVLPWAPHGSTSMWYRYHMSIESPEFRQCGEIPMRHNTFVGCTEGSRRGEPRDACRRRALEVRCRRSRACRPVRGGGLPRIERGGRSRSGNRRADRPVGARCDHRRGARSVDGVAPSGIGCDPIASREGIRSDYARKANGVTVVMGGLSGLPSRANARGMPNIAAAHLLILPCVIA